MVVTPLVRCPRARCRPECDDKPCGRRFVGKVSAHCFEVASFVSSFEGQGLPCPDCDSNNSSPLFVVGGRAESQLSFEVMVHKARLSLLS